MQVLIRDKVKDLQVTSVVLTYDKDDPEGIRMYMFHCNVCGSPLIQYQGHVARIIPGMIPTVLPTVIRCQNSSCKRYYSFQAFI